jgi:hypothetical protein
MVNVTWTELDPLDSFLLQLGRFAVPLKQWLHQNQFENEESRVGFWTNAHFASSLSNTSALSHSTGKDSPINKA